MYMMHPARSHENIIKIGSSVVQATIMPKYSAISLPFPNGNRNNITAIGNIKAQNFIVLLNISLLYQMPKPRQRFVRLSGSRVGRSLLL